jgi:hypothetical protein
MQCRHIRADYTCVAFPNGISPAIWVDGNDHTKHVLGDRGIKFEPRSPGEAPPVFESLELPTLDGKGSEADEPIG